VHGVSTPKLIVIMVMMTIKLRETKICITLIAQR